MRDRILGPLHVAGAEDELLVLVERHLRVLGMRGGREDDAAPAQLAGRDSLPAPLGQPAARGDQALVALRGDAAEGARVRLGPHGHDRVDELDLGRGDRRQELELVVAALFHQDLRQLLELDIRERVAAGPEGGAVKLDRERRRHGRHVNAKDLAPLQLEGIRDDQLAQAGDSRVPHECLVFFTGFFGLPTRKGLLTKRLVRWVFMVATIRIA
jgi:hypothetical protein